jgi:hypothetical protein
MNEWNDNNWDDMERLLRDARPTVSRLPEGRADILFDTALRRSGVAARSAFFFAWPRLAAACAAAVIVVGMAAYYEFGGAGRTATDGLSTQAVRMANGAPDSGSVHLLSPGGHAAVHGRTAVHGKPHGRPVTQPNSAGVDKLHPIDWSIMLRRLHRRRPNTLVANAIPGFEGVIRATMVAVLPSRSSLTGVAKQTPLARSATALMHDAAVATASGSDQSSTDSSLLMVSVQDAPLKVTVAPVDEGVSGYAEAVSSETDSNGGRTWTTYRVMGPGGATDRIERSEMADHAGVVTPALSITTAPENKSRSQKDEKGIIDAPDSLRDLSVLSDDRAGDYVDYSSVRAA